VQENRVVNSRIYLNESASNLVEAFKED